MGLGPTSPARTKYDRQRICLLFVAKSRGVSAVSLSITFSLILLFTHHKCNPKITFSHYTIKKYLLKCVVLKITRMVNITCKKSNKKIKLLNQKSKEIKTTKLKTERLNLNLQRVQGLFVELDPFLLFIFINIIDIL